MTQLSLAQPTSSKVRENSIAAEVNTSSISAGPTERNDNRSYVSLARTALRGLRSPGPTGPDQRARLPDILVQTMADEGATRVYWLHDWIRQTSPRICAAAPGPRWWRTRAITI